MTAPSKGGVWTVPGAAADPQISGLEICPGLLKFRHLPTRAGEGDGIV